MKRLSFALVFGLGATAAFADIDHEFLINRLGAGTGAIAGADLSQLETTPAENIFGYGNQSPLNNNMADDFTVDPGGMIVTGLCFFTYQTGATTPTAISVDWGLDAMGPVLPNNTSAGAASWYMPNGVGVYRLTSATTSDANRRVQLVEVDVPDFFLAAGTYWLSWAVAGSTAFSGPWQPPNPTSTSSFGKNAMQSLADGPFAPVFVDAAGTVGADLPFIVRGTAVPEPATLAILGLGAAALLRRRKKA